MTPLTPHTVKLERPFHAKKALRDFCLAAVNKAAGDNVRFAQVGANDGQLADPIFPFIETGRWGGVMVEPHPTYFAELTTLHLNRPEVQLINCAVSDVAGEMMLYCLAEDQRDAYPAWARGCASLKPNRLHEVLDGHRNDKAPTDATNDIAEVKVPVRPLSEILAETGNSTLDLLVVDVEGFELKVLDSVDLSALNLRAALVECNGSDKGDEGQVAERLAAAGLQTFRFRDDLFAFHPDRCPVAMTDLLAFLGQPPIAPMQNRQNTDVIQTGETC